MTPVLNDKFHGQAYAIFSPPFGQGSESELTLRGLATILGYGIVMLAVCMLGCVAPTRRALKIEPTVALRTE